MWAIYSLLSAVFGGTNAILAKRSVKNADATVVTALRTVVVFLIAWGAAWLGGALQTVGEVEGRSLLFLLLSGVATSLAWLFYFRALKTGLVNRVAAIDKFSTVLTMLGGWLLLGETINGGKLISMAMIAAGILLMIERTSNKIDKVNTDYRDRQTSKNWLLWALLSVLAVSASTLLSKVGVQTVDSRLALAIRTSVVLTVSGCAALVKVIARKVETIDGKSLFYTGVSGAATGFGWLFFFRALSMGDAGVVHPVDKLSIFVTVVLSRILYNERLTLRSGIGLMVLSLGISILVLV